ncbi:MAG: CocE/NonD family hydrolase, partial [Chloroflexi bacterium]|nr:CocE/NonD family hydrolase [Chloroflexota bacterium]
GNMRHGGKWRKEKAWPLERAVQRSYFLDDRGALTLKGPTGRNKVTWEHDPEHPVPSISANVTGFYEWIKLPEGIDTAYVPGRARMRSMIEDGPLHQKEAPGMTGARAPYPLLADRPDVMVFQTPALDEEIEVTGASEVRLWVSSSAPDTDFTAKLLDIYPPSEDYPDGFHLPLVDSILRARFREGFDHEAFLQPGEIYEIVIPLPPISNLFAAGHRIRLYVASSNFPRFDINPNTGEPMGRHTHQEVARNTVHFGPEYPSRITLPIIPAG